MPTLVRRSDEADETPWGLLNIYNQSELEFQKFVDLVRCQCES